MSDCALFATSFAISALGAGNVNKTLKLSINRHTKLPDR